MECDDCTALVPHAEMRVSMDYPCDPCAAWLCEECAEARVQDYGPRETWGAGEVRS